MRVIVRVRVRVALVYIVMCAYMRARRAVAERVPDSAARDVRVGNAGNCVMEARAACLMRDNKVARAARGWPRARVRGAVRAIAYARSAWC